MLNFDIRIRHRDRALALARQAESPINSPAILKVFLVRAFIGIHFIPSPPLSQPHLTITQHQEYENAADREDQAAQQP
jgi:hypothetical protein